MVNLSREEKRTLGAVALLAMVLIVCYGASLLYADYEASVEREEKRQINQTFGMDEWVDLDSEKDLDILSTGTLYAAEFPWEGCIRVAVRSAQLFDGWSAAQRLIGEDREPLLSQEYLDTLAGVLVVSFDVRNVDATSTSIRMDDPYCFSSGVFNVEPFDEIIGFDSPVEELIDQNEVADRYFRLNPGETRAIRIAYGVSEQSELEAGDFSIWVGGFNRQKYVIDLDVKRGDVQ